MINLHIFKIVGLLVEMNYVTNMFLNLELRHLFTKKKKWNKINEQNKKQPMKLLFFPKLECVCADISYTHTVALLQFGLVSSDSTVKRKQRESHTWGCQLLWNQTCVKHSLRRRWDVGGARVYLWVQSKCGHIFDPSWRGEPLPSSEKSSPLRAEQRHRGAV